MAVLIDGAIGSFGKNGISPIGASCVVAVATLAEGLEVVVMARFVMRRVKGCSREVWRKNAMMIELEGSDEREGGGVYWQGSFPTRSAQCFSRIQLR